MSKIRNGCMSAVGHFRRMRSSCGLVDVRFAPRAETHKHLQAKECERGGAADPFVQGFQATTSPRQPEQRQAEDLDFEVTHQGSSNRQLKAARDPTRSRLSNRCLTLRQQRPK